MRTLLKTSTTNASAPSNDVFRRFLNKFEAHGTRNNVRASQLINGLLQLHTDDGYLHQQHVQDSNNHERIVHYVFAFCDSIVQPKDAILINALLQMCLALEAPQSALSLWSDITTLHLLRDAQLSYASLFKCTASCYDVDKSVRVLHWMQERGLRLKVHDHFVSNLLPHATRVEHVRCIHSLLQQHMIRNWTRYTRTQLIAAYSKCGDLEGAQRVFDGACVQMQMHDHASLDVVSVTAMMNAFIEHGCDADALALYQRIEDAADEEFCDAHITRDDICHNLAIKACGNLRDIDAGTEIYDALSLASSSSSIANVFIQNSLIDMFGDCGDVERAMAVYHAAAQRQTLDSASVGAAMKALVNNEADADALQLYDGHNEHTGVMYSLALKACTKLGDYERGRRIHDDILASNLNDARDRFIDTALIDFYGNFNEMALAKQIFDGIDAEQRERDIVVLNAMLTAHLNCHCWREVLQLYDAIDAELQNSITHNIALRACANLCDLEKGSAIHRQLQLQTMRVQNDDGADAGDVQIRNTLISLYGNCANITKAFSVFDGIARQRRDAGSGNAMMSAYSHNALHAECLKLYHATPSTLRDVVSHNIAIHSCGLTSNVDEAVRIYGAVDAAARDIVTVNMMMQVLIHNQRSSEALALYQGVGSRGNALSHLSTNDMAHNLAIKAYTKLRDFEGGKQLIAGVIQDDGDGDENENITLKTRLIDFFGHAQEIAIAKRIFDGIADDARNTSTVNAMLDAYCMNAMYDECLALFETVSSRSGDLQLDAVSYQHALQCCHARGSDEMAQRSAQISEQLSDFLQKQQQQPRAPKHVQQHESAPCSAQLQMSLIQMYGKCGYLQKCDQLFDEIRTQQWQVYSGEISIWNAMIHANGRNGDLRRVKELLRAMESETQLCPNRQTYIDVLNSYGHCDGDENVYEAIAIWSAIDNVLVKYDCIVVTTFVDCLARKQRLYLAYDTIVDFEHKTEEIYYAMWLALLSGCRKCGNMLMAHTIVNEMSKRFNPNDHCMVHASLLVSHLNLTANDTQYPSPPLIE